MCKTAICPINSYVSVSACMQLFTMVFGCEAIAYISCTSIALSTICKLYKIDSNVPASFATSLQTVLDALRARKERFVFEDIEVTLRSTVMAFITMNPGYPGRAELPESLKVMCFCLACMVMCGHHVLQCCSSHLCHFL